MNNYLVNLIIFYSFNSYKHLYITESRRFLFMSLTFARYLSILLVYSYRLGLFVVLCKNLRK